MQNLLRNFSLIKEEEDVVNFLYIPLILCLKLKARV